MIAGNPHLALPVTHAGAPLARARAVAIVLHGRAHTPAMAIEQIVQRIDLPGVAYLIPAAADNSWYPTSFLAQRGDNEPRLAFALERVGALADELVGKGVPLASQVVIGFSQGACLACDYVYRRRARIAALISFTGGLIGPPGSAWPAQRGALVDMPTLFGGSLQDPWVPAERMFESMAVFERLGARVGTRMYDGDRHEVGQAELDAARAILVELGA